MLVQGQCVRFGFRDLTSEKIGYPHEIEVHLGDPDVGMTPLGVAQLTERDDGIWAEFTLSDLDMKVLDGNKYFAVALQQNDDDVMMITHLGLGVGNLDPEIQPVTTS